MRANQDLRRVMRKHGLEFWMVASYMFISERQFSKLMSKELDEETLNDVLNAMAYAEIEYFGKKHN